MLSCIFVSLVFLDFSENLLFIAAPLFINKKSTSVILGEVFDTISISLNAGTEDEYMKVTRPKYSNAFEAMQKFASDCVKTSARVVMTVVDVIPKEQIESAREICRKTGAEFRVRTYDC